MTAVDLLILFRSWAHIIHKLSKKKLFKKPFNDHTIHEVVFYTSIYDITYRTVLSKTSESNMQIPLLKPT